MSQNREEVGLLQQLAEIVAEEEPEEEPEVMEAELDFTNKCTSDLIFRNVIEELEGEFLTVIIKSGANCTGNSNCCCKHDGLICDFSFDLLVLINNGTKVYIPIDSIAAIRKEG